MPKTPKFTSTSEWKKIVKELEQDNLALIDEVARLKALCLRATHHIDVDKEADRIKDMI